MQTTYRSVCSTLNLIIFLVTKMLRSFTRRTHHTATVLFQSRRAVSRVHQTVPKIKFDWRHSKLSTGKLSADKALCDASVDQCAVLDESIRSCLFKQMIDCGIKRNLSIFSTHSVNEFVLSLHDRLSHDKVLQKAGYCLSFQLLDDGDWLITNLVQSNSEYLSSDKKYLSPYRMSHMDMLLMRNDLIRDIVGDDIIRESVVQRPSLAGCLIALTYWLACVALCYFVFLALVCVVFALIGTILYLINDSVTDDM